MKKLKFDKKKKEYSGVAFKVLSHRKEEIIIIGTTVASIRRVYYELGGTLNTKLCAKLKVKVTRG